MPNITLLNLMQRSAECLGVVPGVVRETVRSRAFWVLGFRFALRKMFYTITLQGEHWCYRCVQVHGDVRVIHP